MTKAMICLVMARPAMAEEQRRKAGQTTQGTRQGFAERARTVAMVEIGQQCARHQRGGNRHGGLQGIEAQSGRS